MKTLIVVSGGDAPGINAAIYNFTAPAHRNGDLVVGALGSFEGILAEQITPLAPGDLAPTIGQGGTYLASSRVPVLKDHVNHRRLVSILKKHGIDNLVLLGGEGTLTRIPDILKSHDVACVGIPATIDNDVPGTEQTIGFASACNFAHHTIDGLLATARALPGRIFSVETLGGYTGFIALDVAYVVGAHALLIPEYDYDLERVAAQLQAAVDRCRIGLAVLSEGIADSATFAEQIQAITGQRVRATVLGHGQRGSIPCHQDRKLAVQMTQMAYRALKDGVRVGTVVVRDGRVQLCPDTISALPRRVPDRAIYDSINTIQP
jgi:6-phosphofructokinase 1